MLTAHHRTNRRSAAFRLASNNFGDKYLIIDDDVVGPVAAGVNSRLCELRIDYLIEDG